MHRVIYACSDWDGSTCTSSGHEFHYEYDGAGNATRFDKWNSTTYQVETVHYVYNGANQIDCVDADNNQQCGDLGDIPYTYDAVGNLTDDGTTTYEYDAANRLASVTTGASTTSYTYNGDGDRVSQTANGTLTTYLLDTATPLTMVLSETSNGQTIYYWHGLDTLAQSDGTNVSYFEYDGLGSVRQVVDDAGEVGLSQTFDPYGNPYASVGTASTSLGFTGEFSDSNGFVFLRARYYNPAAGRFFQTDPSRQEMNPYLYATDNPIRFVDLSGELACPHQGLPLEDSIECARQITKTYRGLDALIQLFIAPELDTYNDLMMTTGSVARTRLEWIILITAQTKLGSTPGPQQGNTDIRISDDSLMEDFQAGDHDPDQLSKHFMQGVRFGYDGTDEDLAIRFMILHEISQDAPIVLTSQGIQNNLSLLVSNQDIQWFKDALACDYNGPKGWESRNDLLNSIWVAHASTVGFRGSSMADLRLWLKGYRFGKSVRSGYDSLAGTSGPEIEYRWQAAMWLVNNLRARPLHRNQ